MISTKVENKDAYARPTRARTLLRIALVQAIVIVLVVIAAVSLGTHSVDAHSQSLDNSHGLDHHAHSGPVAASSEEPVDVGVWVADLTVEKASGALGTFVGYLRGVPGRDDRGTLEPAAFVYGGQEFSVQALVIRPRNLGNQTLIFKADHEIPDNLVLHIGDREFPVSESTVMGPRWNIHVWGVVEDLEWTDGQSATVALTATSANQMEPEPILPDAN